MYTGPPCPQIDVGVFVRAHLHRSQGPHILPSRATGILDRQVHPLSGATPLPSIGDHLWHSLLAAVLASSRVPKDSDVVNLQEHRLRF